MKKDRNTFFESSQMSSSFVSAPNMMPNQMMPYQAASNSFYAGPMPPNSMNTYPSAISTTDYDNKIARLERQMQKLETRISKLEGATFKTSTEDINISSNMYMI